MSNKRRLAMLRHLKSLAPIQSLIDNVSPLLIQGGGDVGADKPRAARDHIHARPPSLSPLNSAPIKKELSGAAVPLVGLHRR